MIISWLLGTNQIRWFYFSTFLTCSYGTKVERIEKVSHSKPLIKDSFNKPLGRAHSHAYKYVTRQAAGRSPIPSSSSISSLPTTTGDKTIHSIRGRAGDGEGERVGAVLGRPAQARHRRGGGVRDGGGVRGPAREAGGGRGRGVARGGGGGAPVLLLQQGEAGGGGERHGARLLLAAAAGHRRGRPGERALELLSPHPARRIAALPPGDRSERDDDDEDDDDQISA